MSLDFTPVASIPGLVTGLRSQFNSGISQSLEWRKKQLMQLFFMVDQNKAKWNEALHKDLRKPSFEAELCEIVVVQNEITGMLASIDEYSATETPSVDLVFAMDGCQVRKQPVGVVLIISPWNYPVQLCLSPLVGAIAAGCGVVLKPSEHAPATSRLFAELLPKYLDPSMFVVVNGAIPETTKLLEQKFDHIFYTGSTVVGKIIMTAASKNLTPVTLELGGKSPCIVSKKLSREGLQNAANRIAWGKFMNAGQTCIAPDYILVHPEQKEAFVAAIKLAFKEMFGGDSSSAATQSCGDYCRIINSVQHSRLTNLLSRQLSVNSNSKIVLGGAHDLKDLFIEPTIVEGVGMDPEANPLMKDELFGPILPIIEANLDEAIKYINSRDRPLCAYVFSEDKATIEKVLKLTTSGGVCVNDTLMHTLPGELPFGGIGPSGMGAYHGKASFDIFTHKKSVMNRGIGLESVKKLIYAPYTTSKMNLLKMLMGKKPSKPNLVFGVFGWMVKRVVRSWGIIGWIFALYFYTKN